LLGQEILADIAKELPELKQLNLLVLTLAPDFISLNFPPESSIPEAAVCLRDATEVLLDANYALGEIFAHKVWYLEKRDVPSPGAAAHFGRFYADDTALRLYAASEHLANAIVCMLEIQDQELKPYKQRRVSQQSIVGHFLIKEKPHHPITQAVLKLIGSKEWNETRKYRDVWVHEQPPLVKGRGIVYERRKRWVVTDKGKHLSFGGGDKPQYSADDLTKFIQPATFLFAEILTAVVRFYIDLLQSHGINLDEDEFQLSAELFNT
jgi:hypothetical protein